jgi:hypothetical protein
MPLMLTWEGTALREEDRGACAPRTKRWLFAQRIRRVTLALLVAPALCAALAPASAGAAVAEPGPTPAAPGLPDGRIYEQVSPVKKNGNQAGPSIGGENAYGVASPDGSRVLYSSTGPIGEAPSGVDAFSVSERSASGWSTKAVLPQPPPAPRDPVSPFDPVWLMTSADLGSAAFIAHNPYTTGGVDFTNPSFAFASAYLTHGGQPAEWLGAPTAEDPYPPLEENIDTSSMALVGASADFGTIYFEYYGTLVPADEPRRSVVASGNDKAWGIYEWREGQLKAAGLLPSGKEDEYGVEAAGIGENFLNVTPPAFDNEVSLSGNTALFLSPAPEAESGRTPQLYARLNGNTTVLVTGSDLTGEPSLKGPAPVAGLSEGHPDSFAYGSPDGSMVFFASEEQLTSEAPANTSLKEYRFDLGTDTLTYLPGVTPPILSSSTDGSTFVFDDTTTGHNQLAIWSKYQVTDITPLPAPQEEGEPSEEELYVAPVRLTGTTVVFQTDSPLPGFNNGEEDFGQVYKYELATDGLSCVSCPPTGQLPTGSASLSNDSVHRSTHLVVDNRGISEDGSEIFFDSPDPLVPQDENETRDVYEWHSGLLSLISSGKGTAPSIFLDNSASGNDVFFATREDLSGSDTDGSYDIYDARVGGGFPGLSEPSPGCLGVCATGIGSPPPALPTLSSTSVLGAGEQVVPGGGHSGHAAPTRAQKLTKSLTACRRERGKRRRSCEARARKRYGPHRSRKRA